MYGLLSTLLYWPSDCVVKQGLHVSTMCTCHRGDARVTRASHIQGLCISMSSYAEVTGKYGCQVMPVTQSHVAHHSFSLPAAATHR